MTRSGDKSETMKTQALFPLLLLACMYPSLAQGSFENCCLRYAREVKSRIKQRVVSYTIQDIDGGCNIRAVIFKLKKEKTFCGDPQQLWVQELMNKMDRRKERTQREP